MALLFAAMAFSFASMSFLFAAISDSQASMSAALTLIECALAAMSEAFFDMDDEFDATLPARVASSPLRLLTWLWRPSMREVLPAILLVSEDSRAAIRPSR